jgi:hypothetical protein
VRVRAFSPINQKTIHGWGSDLFAGKTVGRSTLLAGNRAKIMERKKTKDIGDKIR